MCVICAHPVEIIVTLGVKATYHIFFFVTNHQSGFNPSPVCFYRFSVVVVTKIMACLWFITVFISIRASNVPLVFSNKIHKY